MKISGRKRLSIVLSTGWIILVFILIEPGEEGVSLSDLKTLIVYGILPVASIWAFRWIWHGYKMDRKNGEAMDKSILAAIARVLMDEQKLEVTGYTYETSKVLHVLVIQRKGEVGELAFSGEFASDHTEVAIVKRLKGQDMKRQLMEFHGKRIIIHNTGVRVEIGN